MRLDLHPILPSLALAALALSGPSCSDDGVPTQQGGSTEGADGNGSSGISTTMTAGSMSSPADDGLDDGDTGLGTTGAPPPGTGTTDEPGDSTAAEDGTASDTGSSSGGTGSESSSGSGSGSDSGSSSDSGGEPLCDASARPGELPVGSACPQDSACESGVCYDFADYDALCGGTACSVCCETDEDCVDAMQAAGAPFPAQTFCLADGRCDMVGTGLGGPFFCAGG
jgi:hypothetical protein